MPTNDKPKAAETIRVRCILDIDVDVPADMDERSLQFAIEENSCPGTGLVGLALAKHMELYDNEKSGYCWACSLQGTNMILQDRPKNHQNR